MLASQILTDVPASDAQDPYRSAWDVVLGMTGRGEAELRQPLVRLSRAQRQLLAALDGRRSLQLLVARQPDLASPRLSRDAARLLAFGLVRQVHGELPRELVVAAMNLTLQLPANAASAWAATASRPSTAPATVEQMLPPEEWPDIEPDEWADDEPDASSPQSVQPGLLHALPYMAMASGLTLLLAWLLWR